MILSFIEILKVIVLGIVEGITEWLPISSTGHMLLFDEFLQLNTSEGFKEVFFVLIQLGAILAVILLYCCQFGTKHRNPLRNQGISVFLCLVFRTYFLWQQFERFYRSIGLELVNLLKIEYFHT